jgi:hypothetical protein
VLGFLGYKLLNRKKANLEEAGGAVLVDDDNTKDDDNKRNNKSISNYRINIFWLQSLCHYYLFCGVVVD